MRRATSSVMMMMMMMMRMMNLLRDGMDNKIECS